MRPLLSKEKRNSWLRQKMDYKVSPADGAWTSTYEDTRYYVTPDVIHELDDIGGKNAVATQLEWDVAETRGLVRWGKKIGKGATGSVYEGTLQCGTTVAVKVVDVSLDISPEINALCMYRHPAIVNFMGYARGKRNQYLVFENCPNRDLAFALYGNDNDNVTKQTRRVIDNVRKSWIRRALIAVDLAAALAYLHSRRPPLFHRDIKSGNLLLDNFGRAKLADFGLAVLAESPDATSVKVRRSEGTPGYADPHSVETHCVGPATDVFSFGVVLVELLTGQCPAVYARDLTDGKCTIRYFAEIIDFDDPCSLLTYVDTRCVWPTWLPFEWSELALKCMAHLPEDRPSAFEVLQELRYIIQRFGGNVKRLKGRD